MRALATALALMALVPSISQAATSKAAPAPAPKAAPAAPDAVPFFMSGGSLAEACNQFETDPVAQVACVLYITGVVDAYNQEPGTRVCMIMSATRVDMAQIMIAWLKAHPNENTSPAASLVKRAMSEAYPCPKN